MSNLRYLLLCKFFLIISNDSFSLAKEKQNIDSIISLLKGKKKKQKMSNFWKKYEIFTFGRNMKKKKTATMITFQNNVFKINLNLKSTAILKQAFDIIYLRLTTNTGVRFLFF